MTKNTVRSTEAVVCRCGCTHTGVTEPVVWPGVRQVETVLTQQQLIQLEEKRNRERKERRKKLSVNHSGNIWTLQEFKNQKETQK